MRVLIIDWRDARRGKLQELIQGSGHTADPYALAAQVPAELRPELLLLHVGSSQEQEGDNIDQTLQRFSECLVLCYKGGIAARAAENREMLNVALFPFLVPKDEPGEDLSRTVKQVLAQWPQREHLGQDWFRALVSGFDPVLEAKLEVLVAVLKGADAPEGRLKLLRSKCPGAFSQDILACDGTTKSVARLRKILFNEDPWERSA